MRLGAAALGLAFLPVPVALGLAGAPAQDATVTHVTTRWIAVSLRGRLAPDGPVLDLVKINCDGTIWVNWPVLPTAIKLGAVPPSLGLALVTRRGTVPTLSDAQQDRKERGADRDPALRRCFDAIGQWDIGATFPWSPGKGA